MPQEDRLSSWVDRFPYEDIVAELEDLQKRVQALNTRMFALQDLKQMYERVRALQAAGQLAPGPLPTQPLPPGHPPFELPATVPGVVPGTVPGIVPGKPTLRDSIQAVMSDNPLRGWTTDELWDELTTRGWLRRDEQGRANMFSMLSTMTTQGQLQRVKRGVYRVKVSAPITDLLREVELP